MEFIVYLKWHFFFFCKDVSLLQYCSTGLLNPWCGDVKCVADKGDSVRSSGCQVLVKRISKRISFNLKRVEGRTESTILHISRNNSGSL